MKTRYIIHLALLAASFALVGGAIVACDDDNTLEEEEHQHDDEDLHAEGCEHMAEAASVSETATDPTSTDTPPDVTVEHARADLAFVAIDGGNGGLATFSADAAGEMYVFVSNDAPLAFFDGSGNELAIEETEAVDDCSEVSSVHVIDVEVGTVTLSFGPTTETSIGLVFEEGGEHDHEE